MARPINSKERDCIRDAVSIFGCVRESTLIKFADLINCTKFSATSLVRDTISKSLLKRYTVTQTQYVKSSIVTDADFTATDAFEAYVALLAEHPEISKTETEVKVSAARYPYNYVVTFNGTTNLLLIYDRSGYRRLVHHNRSARSESEDPNENIILVVPSGYDINDIGDIRICGQYRIAVIREAPNGTTLCKISEVAKGEIK